MTALLLVAAIAADSLTYALMPAGHEANPIVIAAGLWAVLARWVAVAVLIALAAWSGAVVVPAARPHGEVRESAVGWHPYPDPVPATAPLHAALRVLLLVGACAGVVGAMTNVWGAVG